MPLLNYSTTIEASKTVLEIQNILAKHGAKSMIMNYDASGQVESLYFIVDTPQGRISIRLPINVESIMRILDKQYKQGKIPYKLSHDRSQAIRIAWRILKDWVEAQMALLETEMVKLEQIFLPYVMVDNSRTLYEVFSSGNLLPQGRDIEGEFTEIKS